MRRTPATLWMIPICGLLTLALPGLEAGAYAQEHEAEEHEEPLPNEGYFEIGLFLGLASEIERNHEGDEEHSDDKQTDGAYGIELYYRGWEHFGVGFLVEGVGVRLARTNTSILLLGYHPIRPVRIVVGPGVERVNDEDHEMIFRVGGGYGWEIGKGWVLMPEFNVDFIEKGQITLVYGINLTHEL